MPHPPILLQTTEQTQDPVVTDLSIALVAVRTRRNARLFGGNSVTHALSPPARISAAPALERVTLMGWLVQPPAKQAARAPHYKLSPPTVLATFAGPTVHLVRSRPRHTARVLSPPTTLRTFAGPAVHLAKIRPPRTKARIAPPTVTLTPVFAGPVAHSVRSRPRPTTASISPPAVVVTPSLDYLHLLRVCLAASQPGRDVRRRSKPTLGPPIVVEALPPLIRVSLSTWMVVSTRHPDRKTHATLAKPATLEPASVAQAERTIRVVRTRIRPPHKRARLAPPTVVLVPAVEQQRRTIKVRLIRARPRPTLWRIRPPAVVAPPLPVVTALSVKTTAGRRPRAIHTFIHPPTVLSVFQAGRPTLVATRPRKTTFKLFPPTVLGVFQTGRPSLVSTRPPHTISALRPPAVVAPFVEPLVSAIRTRLIRIIPAAIRSRLFPVPFAPVIPGEACLTDHLANEACLDDQLADTACLTDDLSDVGCLDEQLADEACLTDVSAATAKLEDKE